VRVLKPRALRPGDRIAVVSPASPFKREEFDLGVQTLRDLGFEPVWASSVFDRTGYVSGSASIRAGAFLDAWKDPSIAALIAARGGYGSVHLLPLLDAETLRQTPKIFIGYSDNTSMLTWLTIGCGITALHGPMLEGRLAKGEAGYHKASFLAALGTEPAGELTPPTLTNIQGGEAVGPLHGGTLTQILASLGTPYAFTPPEGSILFIEDVNERSSEKCAAATKWAGIRRRSRRSGTCSTAFRDRSCTGFRQATLRAPHGRCRSECGRA
jgi:muramoyltetrapeptide carboxypeptidase